MDSVCGPAPKCGGLPHSDILGSKRVCRSPRLFAAYHVLHRLPVPRHPPCALSSLTTEIMELSFGESKPKKGLDTLELPTINTFYLCNCQRTPGSARDRALKSTDPRKGIPHRLQASRLTYASASLQPTTNFQLLTSNFSLLTSHF